MALSRVLLFLAVTFLARSVMAQQASTVSVINTPGVTVENVPGVTVENMPAVTIVNTPGVTVTNSQESPAYVSVVDGVQTEPQTVIEYRVVGYTQTTSSGRIEAEGGLLVGYAAMHRLCADEVASNSRAAFASEALRPAPLLVQPNSRVAWVLPAALESWPEDASEIADATCGWHEDTSSAAGLVSVPFAGRIAEASCEASLPIACSAPVAIPVTQSP